MTRRRTSVYRCALQVTRGYPSLTVIRDLSQRVPEGSRLVILYLGDFDPSGEDIFRHISREAREKFTNVTLEKVALREEDIKRFGLPPVPAKRTDPRYKKFVRRHGNRAVELDALPPQVLLEKVGEAILRFTDLDAQARSNYEVFLFSSGSQLVDEALGSLRTRLLNAALTHLREDLDAEAQVAAAKEALRTYLKPQLTVPDDLQRRIRGELAQMLSSGSGWD